jgi:hypothetical protein
VVAEGAQPLTLRVRELDDVMNLMTIAGCFRTVGRTLYALTLTLTLTLTLYARFPLQPLCTPIRSHHGQTSH